MEVFTPSKNSARLNSVQTTSASDSLLKGVYDSFIAQEQRMDLQTGVIGQGQVSFIGNFTGSSTSLSYIEDYMHIQNGSYSYGIVKLQNNTFGAFFRQQDPNDPAIINFRYQGWRTIANLKSYYLEEKTRSLIYGDGTNLYNMTLNIIVSRTQADVVIGTEFLNAVTIQSGMPHTSFRFYDSGFLLLACATCNNSLGFLRLYQRTDPP